MPGKIFLHLLIICVIWSQKITGTIADEEIGESSDILVRQKRVINRIPDQDQKVKINHVPYIVKIKQNRGINCVGSILSHHVVITAALCVEGQVQEYSILSAAARLDKGTYHTVRNIIKRYGNHPGRPTDGIALLIVNPAFVFGTSTNYIQLHSYPLLQGTVGIISGWGYNPRSSDPGTCFPRNLRSIEVPIMAHRDCVNIYRPFNIEISDVDICTFHTQKHCGHIDGGVPLVVDNYLAGVHLWTGPGRVQYQPDYPDVFAILQHSAYNQWIRSNIDHIEAQLEK